MHCAWAATLGYRDVRYGARNAPSRWKLQDTGDSSLKLTRTVAYTCNFAGLSLSSTPPRSPHRKCKPRRCMSGELNTQNSIASSKLGVKHYCGPASLVLRLWRCKKPGRGASRVSRRVTPASRHVADDVD